MAQLHHKQIKEINDTLLEIYYHPLGGDLVKGSLLATLYEKTYGIDNHGYEDNKWYRLSTLESPRGFYVLVSETNERPVYNEPIR